MSDLKQVISLAKLLVQQESKYKVLEAQTLEAKKAFLRTEREDLPTLMEELGLKEVTLEDGSKVSVVAECDCSITQANRASAMGWLLKNGFGGLIKTQVSVVFGRGDRSAAEAVRDELITKYEGVTLEENVHPSTLKSFVKEQMAEGRPLPMDLFGVRPYSKAKLKKGA